MVKPFFISILSGYCEGSNFIDKDCDYMVSGYLQIVKNNKQRTKSPYYIQKKIIFHGKWLKQASWRFSMTVLTQGVIKDVIDKSILPKQKGSIKL